MTKASINLQDLRRRIYVKAKAETTWRFWGLYVHVCKMETLSEAPTVRAKRTAPRPPPAVTLIRLRHGGRSEPLVL
jgi:RNA-directed DNA polymerase